MKKDDVWKQRHELNKELHKAELKWVEDNGNDHQKELARRYAKLVKEHEHLKHELHHYKHKFKPEYHELGHDARV
jgi:hypothetical protein